MASAKRTAAHTKQPQDHPPAMQAYLGKRGPLASRSMQVPTNMTDNDGDDLSQYSGSSGANNFSA